MASDERFVAPGSRVTKIFLGEGKRASVVYVVFLLVGEKPYRLVEK